MNKIKKNIKLHPRNFHKGNYDLNLLSKTIPALKQFVVTNKYNNYSIDFFNPKAVKFLNKALLKQYYSIQFWDIPEGFLCPPIPGRADYIHHIADLLALKNNGIIPNTSTVKGFDIGVGANCIYPIIGNALYQWKFIGTDINKQSIASAQKIVLKNQLNKYIELRYQNTPKHIFKGVLKQEEFIDFTICNPPFHNSLAEAKKGTLRKLNNLKKIKNSDLELNFGGKQNEIWCEGGEIGFIKKMILESKNFYKNCFWFSCLISKESHLKTVYQMLKKANVFEKKTIKMAQGNKTSRFVVWTFLTHEEQISWSKSRWNPKDI